MLATSIDDVREFVAMRLAFPTPVGFDLETTGLKAERSEIIGIALACKSGSLYIPTMHRELIRDKFDGALDIYNEQVAEYDAEREQGIPKKDRKWPKKPTKPKALTLDEQLKDLPLWEGNVALASALEELAPLFACTKIPLIAHNGPFDLRHLREQARQTGIELPFPRGHYHDSLLMSYALSDHLAQTWGGLDLDTCADRVLGDKKDERKIQDFLDARGVKKGVKARKLMLQWCPPEAVAEYAEHDAMLALRLVGKLLPRLKADPGCMTVYMREIALVEATVAMEETPKWIDMDYVDRTIAAGEKRLAELRADVVKAAGYEFNVDSPDELSHVLLKKGIKLPPSPATAKAWEEGRTPKKIGYSTDVKVLEPYRHLPIVASLLRYRALGKRIGTDFAGVKEHAIPHRNIPGVALLYPGLSQTTARTGRYSSSLPNFQNWSRDDDTDEWAEEFSIRRCMIVNPETHPCTACDGSGGTDDRTMCAVCCGTGTTGRLLIDVDLKQIEPRLTAHLTRDPNLIKVYLEGRDVYVEIGKVAFAIDLTLDDKAWKKARPDERQAAKSLVLAILYGAGMSKVAIMVVDSVLSTIDGRYQMLKRKLLGKLMTAEEVDAALAEMRALKARRNAFKFDHEDSRRVIDKMNGRFPGIFDYKDYLSQRYEENGFIRNPWGRKLYLAFADATYTLLNAMVQSSAADLFKQATIDTFFALRREGLDCHLIWTIHDALIFDVAAEHAHKAIVTIRREMCKFKLRVPLEIDISVTAGSWADSIEVNIDGGIPWEQVWSTARSATTGDTSGSQK